MVGSWEADSCSVLRPQVPSPPGDEDEDFILVHHSDVQLSEKAEEVYTHLAKILKEQYEVGAPKTQNINWCCQHSQLKLFQSLATFPDELLWVVFFFSFQSFIWFLRLEMYDSLQTVHPPGERRRNNKVSTRFKAAYTRGSRLVYRHRSFASSSVCLKCFSKCFKNTVTTNQTHFTLSFYFAVSLTILYMRWATDPQRWCILSVCVSGLRRWPRAVRRVSMCWSWLSPGGCRLPNITLRSGPSTLSGGLRLQWQPEENMPETLWESRTISDIWVVELALHLV